MAKKIYLLICVAFLSISLFGCNETERTYEEFPVYSDSIEKIEFVGMLTGVNAYDNTLEKWDIGGTDLGIPYYDEQRGQMYFLFGDTFRNNNGGSGNWRSQVVGVTKDLDASDGIKFDSFISEDKRNGYATQIIDAMHDSNDAEYEITVIPTGAIVIDGIHYVYYMSVRIWHTIGWDVNYCGVAKSTDGQKFEIIEDLFWSDPKELGQLNTGDLLDQDAEVVLEHTGGNFLQIFPYRVGDYVYIFGIPNARFGGCKLGRVLASEIEDFSKYEYYTGKDANEEPVWVQGADGLRALDNNDESYIFEPQVGELSVSYNEYLGKYVMSFYSLDRIVVTYSENLIDWSDLEILISSNDLPVLYGGFTHELYMEEKGKVMYFYVSWYYQTPHVDDAYNVNIMRVTFK